MNLRFYQLLTTRFSFYLIFAFPVLSYGQNDNLRLWYAQPAQRWEETLALGNGKLGMMPDGKVEKERIVLNDITLWSGGPQEADNEHAHENLKEIRKLLLEEKNDEAQALVNKSFICKGAGSGHGESANLPFGCYQTLGFLDIDYSYEGSTAQKVKAVSYKRELSLNNAMATTKFMVGNVSYTREYFTSFGTDISVVRLSASKPGQINCRISLTRPERYSTVSLPDGLQMSGQLNNGTDGKGMRYTCRLRTRLKEGTQRSEKGDLVISKASEVILYISSATDYKGLSIEDQISTIDKAAKAKSFDEEKKMHVSNYQKLFKRLTLEIGSTPAKNTATDQRITEFESNPAADTGLPALLFQFGRYLTICSTRTGLLPPNLQGLWANQIQTPWNGDYHLDVNVEMNHWPVEVSNLSELNLPMAELVRGLVTTGERTAKSYYNAEGWVAHVITNIWGFTSPGEEASWGSANCGSGWICNNLWEHYLFSRDNAYLKSIYPILKGSAQFYSSVLVKEPKNNWLVTSPSVSPENWFVLPNGKQASICMGPTIDNQITRELFTNVITASELLNTDAPFREALKAKLKQLPPPGRIGSDGRLMEWLEEYKEAEPTHRHISHLYGLYPASLITPELTPDLANACRKTLDARGDDATSWSIVYKLLFWARLKDGNRAHTLLTKLLRPVTKTDMNYGAGGGIYPNMLSACPPFQIDANFGGAAGIAEMLIQSHAGFIELLPALPDAWKSSGAVTGLRARGNFTVDFQWKEGRVTNYSITSPDSRVVKVKINGTLQEVTAKKI